MEVSRNHASLQDQRRLDQSGHASGRFQMTDIGLYGTDEKRAVGCSPLPVDRGHGVDLDRIADFRSGPMGLQVVHLQPGDSCVGQRRFHHFFQSGGVRHRQPDARSAMVHGSAADHGPDPVAVRFRFAQPLENDDPATLTSHVPVRRCVERLALAVRRQHHRIGAQLVDATVQDRLYAAGDGQIRFALLQVRHCVVDRYHG